MTRQVNDESLSLIQQWEGLRLTAYNDAGGVLTIGYGHTGPDVKPGMTIAPQQAMDYLRDDLAYAEHVVEENVRQPLTDSQFGALVSFVYNIGAGKAGVKDGFVTLRNGKPSTLLTVLTEGRYDEVPDQMMQWVNVSGVRSAGLVNRRTAEVALWNRGAYVASSSVTPDAPVPGWRVVLSALRTKLHGLGLTLISSGTYAAHQVTNADPSKLQDAGQKIQQYAGNYHKVVALGIALCVVGVLLDVFHRKDG